MGFRIAGGSGIAGRNVGSQCLICTVGVAGVRGNVDVIDRPLSAGSGYLGDEHGMIDSIQVCTLSPVNVDYTAFFRVIKCSEFRPPAWSDCTGSAYIDEFFSWIPPVVLSLSGLCVFWYALLLSADVSYWEHVPHRAAVAITPHTENDPHWHRA